MIETAAAPTVARFPRYADFAREVVEEHSRIEDETLLLALYYAPEREPQDVFLFEVHDRFGGNSIDPDRDFFEIQYGDPHGELGLEPGQWLRVVLTNPLELEVALREGWPLAREIRKAVYEGNYQKTYAAPEGERLLEAICG